MVETVCAGALLLDKPPGPTSHDMVEAVRRLSGILRVGHTGTLDPMASGLLVILLGRATKLAGYVPDDPKVYRGTMVLGLTTDTMDMEGKIIERHTCRAAPEEVSRVMESMVGELEQEPPLYSAAKYKGRPLYSYARRGEEPPRRKRRVRVYGFRLQGWRAVGGLVEVDFTVSCSPGTYVRGLASMVGERLGCGGALSALRRLASGPFRVEEALTPEELTNMVDKGDLPLLSPLQALRGYRVLPLKESCAKAARNGVPLREEMLEEGLGDAAAGELVAVARGGELVGLYSVEDRGSRILRPRRIF